MIQTSLSSDDDDQLKNVRMHMKQQTGQEAANLRILGEFISGEFDESMEWRQKSIKFKKKNPTASSCSKPQPKGQFKIC